MCAYACCTIIFVCVRVCVFFGFDNFGCLIFFIVCKEYTICQIWEGESERAKKGRGKNDYDDGGNYSNDGQNDNWNNRINDQYRIERKTRQLRNGKLTQTNAHIHKLQGNVQSTSKWSCKMERMHKTTWWDKLYKYWKTIFCKILKGKLQTNNHKQNETKAKTNENRKECGKQSENRKQKV